MFSIKKVMNLGIMCCMVVLLTGCGSKFPLPDKPIEQIIVIDIRGEEEVRTVIKDQEMLDAFLQALKKAKKEYVGHIDFGTKIMLEIVYKDESVFVPYSLYHETEKSGLHFGDNLYEIDLSLI